MDTKKLEHIIIVILLLLNVFLLAVVLSDAMERRNAERETAEALRQLLTENGIEIAPEVALVQTAPKKCTVVRATGREEQRVSKLIGMHSSEDLGGSILFYHSSRGELVVRGTGEFDMLLTGGSVSRGKCERYLSRAGVALYPVSGVEDSENEWFRCCGWNGYPVYNAVLSITFTGNQLNMVSGTMVFHEETASSDESVMDSASVLVRFLSLSKSEGIIFSRLDGLSPGYYMRVTMSGESTLTPMWHITTDTAEFYLNAVTGQLEPPPAV